MDSSPAATIEKIDASTLGARPLRHFDFVMAAFVVVLVLSNVIGAAKLASVTLFGQPFIFGAGILFFPISYVIGDVLTEVYGYARARRCIWAGFWALIFLAVMTVVVVAMPPAPGWEGQAAYEGVFGTLGVQTLRIVGASIAGFWGGEFVNAFVLSRMKLLTQGRLLWTRTIGSTVFGQAVDSLIFYPIAFLGVWSTEQVLAVMVSNWALKVAWEVLLTPVTYKVVNGLKRAEGLDIYDSQTDFTPFKTRI
ncbi:MAG: queuosine precursor transporter [Sphingobium sp.]|uniref:queuosine precursor transporter n=1 Tax=Sphingobium sp. CECT 9361 TaxID=2845384 RepID=UPI001E5F3981|nr:queuosine precursor transporter [Sphingobium sp. CECT 9361]CAH0350121.1 queuosine precursor transporter [Sphingobium sp. CECT 9361]